MPELTREEKLKLVEKLPPRLQELMTSEDTGAALLYLSQKYHLSDHQVRLLSKILGEVVLGITPATNLSSEISTKAAVDMQTSSGLVQDLNDLILSPKLATTVPTPTPITPMPSVSPVPTVPPKPVSQPVIPLPVAPTPKTDQYREPMRETPEVIDLRKTPPPPMQMPIAAAPIPPAMNKVEPPRPLTFTKPIEKLIEPPKPIPAPIPLIEAEPHKIVDLPRPPMVSPSTPLRTSAVEPQYIIRPPGLAPTPTFKVGAPTPAERGVGADLPHDVLDLRKDKGEF